jgi:hypothetical protein
MASPNLRVVASRVVAQGRAWHTLLIEVEDFETFIMV